MAAAGGKTLLRKNIVFLTLLLNKFIRSRGVLGKRKDDPWPVLVQAETQDLPDPRKDL